MRLRSTERPRRRLATVITLTAIGASPVVSSPAQAGPTAEEQATAEILFKSALSLMKAGDHAQACPKLDEVVRLTEGLGAKLELARCLERQGKLASAWALYREVAAKASLAGQGARAKAATTVADGLEPRLSMLALRVEAPAKAITGLEIKRDGKVVRPETWDVRIPVDAGKHTIEVSAPGHEPYAEQIDVSGAGGEVVATVRPPTPLPPPAASSVAVAPPPPPPPAPASSSAARPEAPPAAEPPSRPLLMAGLATGGIGLLTLGGGGLLGLVARTRYDDAHKDGHCDDAGTCDDVGLTNVRDARQLGNVATVISLVGLAGVGTGVVLLLLDSPPAKSSQRVRVAPSVGALSGFEVIGTW